MAAIRQLVERARTRDAGAEEVQRAVAYAQRNRAHQTTRPAANRTHAQPVEFAAGKLPNPQRQPRPVDVVRMLTHKPVFGHTNFRREPALPTPKPPSGWDGEDDWTTPNMEL
jgi:hypothetical protein